MAKLPTGVGMFIWQLGKCGTPEQVVARCKEVGLEHLDQPAVRFLSLMRLWALLSAKQHHRLLVGADRQYNRTSSGPFHTVAVPRCRLKLYRLPIRIP